MKINVHAGHNPDKKVACGAVGLIRESTEARKVKDIVIKLLKSEGHTVYDCTVDDGRNSGDVLTRIVKNCNAHDVDLDVSIHFNSGRKDPDGDGVIGGTEVLVYATGGEAEKYADKIAKAISALGFRNRGVKLRPELYFLRKTKAQAVLIECCFVDDADDVKLYNASKMAQAIVKGITGKKIAVTELVENDTFLVKVKVNQLNIRANAGTEYPIVGVIKNGGVYTIIKTKGNWGLLKSKKGWINISNTYVQKL